MLSSPAPEITRGDSPLLRSWDESKDSLVHGEGCIVNTRHNQSARPAIMRRIGAAMTAIAVALGVSLASAPTSHAEPLTGASWVATPNGVAWTPQTVTVKTRKHTVHLRTS